MKTINNINSVSQEYMERICEVGYYGALKKVIGAMLMPFR